LRVMCSYRRKSKRRRSNTSDVNRDNQDQEKKVTLISSDKSLGIRLQTKIDERRKERALVSPIMTLCILGLNVRTSIDNICYKMHDHALRSSINLKSEELPD